MSGSATPLADDGFIRGLGWFGVGFALISAVTWILAPIHVSSGESGVDLEAHYETHRTALLAFGYAAALGGAMQLAFVVGLRSILRAAGREQGLARLGLVCMLAEVVIVAVGFAIFASLAHTQPASDVAAPLTDLAWFLIDQAAGPVTAVGLVSLTLALATGGLVRRWVVAYTLAVGAAHLVVAGAVAEDGFFSPAGTVAFVVPLAFFSWFLVVGLELVRASRPAPAS